MKLVYLASSPGVSLRQSGGAGTHMRGTIQGFRSHGIDVLPIIGGDKTDSIDDGLSPVPETERRSTKKMRTIFKRIAPSKFRLFLRDLKTMYQSYQFEKQMLPIIKDFSPDAIYERSGYLSFCGNRIARKLSIPLFLETDGCMVEIISDNYGVFSKAIGNYYEKIKLKKAEHIVVYNQTSISFVSAKFKLENKFFTVKTLGISDDSYPVNEDIVLSLKQSLNIKHKLVVGFLGMISSYHGIYYLLDAAKYLKHRSDIVIIIVGGSKELDNIKKIIVEEKLNIILTGRVSKEEVGVYYKLFDIGIVPDAVENIYPVKVLEYGIFNVCPLVPRYPCFEEIIKEGETGHYFEPRNPKAIAEVIKQINIHKNSLMDCAANWNKQVKKNFQWHDTVSNVVQELKLYANSPSS